MSLARRHRAGERELGEAHRPEALLECEQHGHGVLDRLDALARVALRGVGVVYVVCGHGGETIGAARGRPAGPRAVPAARGRRPATAASTSVEVPAHDKRRPAVLDAPALIGLIDVGQRAVSGRDSATTRTPARSSAAAVPPKAGHTPGSAGTRTVADDRSNRPRAVPSLDEDLPRQLAPPGQRARRQQAAGESGETDLAAPGRPRGRPAGRAIPPAAAASGSRLVCPRPSSMPFAVAARTCGSRST